MGLPWSPMRRPCRTCLSCSGIGVRSDIHVVGLLIYLIGLGLGPWFTGILSDVLSVSQGNEGLCYTLMIVTVVNVWCAGHYLFAARDLRSDVAKAPA